MEFQFLNLMKVRKGPFRDPSIFFCFFQWHKKRILQTTAATTAVTTAAATTPGCSPGSTPWPPP